MSGTDELRDLRSQVADHLEARADVITEQWIAKVKELRGPGAFRRLSADEARDHVPQLVTSIADDVRAGELRPSPDNALDYLRLHVELRREQGYDIQEILDEFEVLPQVVGAEVAAAVSAAGDERIRSVAEVFSLAYGNLGRIGATASRSFAEGQVAERRELMERLGEFARTLEHEIRNPLNNAFLCAELLHREGIEPRRRREYADRLQSELHTVEELLTEIRRLSIVEEGALEEHFVPLRAVVDDVFERLAEMASIRNVELRREVLSDHEVWVKVPHVRLALRNLVANAIKYSDPAKASRWVRVTWHRSGDAFRVSVEDNGRGIPAELKDRVFEAGVRAHTDTGGGTGLGLTIVRDVLAQRGGTASVESREGEGTTFELELPFPLSSGEEPVATSIA